MKYVKKQAQLLQKSKGKNDELLKQISSLEDEKKLLQEKAQSEVRQ
jgi:cell division protein FtsB